MRRAVALAACLAAVACGGGAAKTAPPQAGTAPLGSLPGVADRCAARAGDDPAEMSLCLASHGVKVGEGADLRRCVARVHDGAAMIACLRTAAR
jgi:hypothetical protein